MSRVFVRLLIATTLVGAAAVPAQAASAHSGGCERVSERVTLSPQASRTYKVVGWLCGKKNAGTVQVLVSGFTYDHHYWNMPLRGDRYSYVSVAGKQGAVLNIDRIGVGESDRPPASEVTVPAEGWVLAQLATKLRAGQVGHGHHRYSKVVGTGHSLGGSIVISAQADYRPFDALVVNGWLGATDPATVAHLGTIRHPAASDPKFENAGLPEGYVTTKPGTRSAYYTTQYADPRVIRLDERLKQTATSGEVTTLGTGRNPALTNTVSVPVLLWVGQQDTLHCNEAVGGLSCANRQAIREREESRWQATTCLAVYVQPRSGHDTSLHYTAPQGAQAATNWVTAVTKHKHRQHSGHCS